MTDEQKRRIRESFVEYRRNRKLRLKDIAKKIGLSYSTIRTYFIEHFGDEYKRIAKMKNNKGGFRKLSKVVVKNAFKEYKGDSKLKLEELAKRLKVSRTTLRKSLKEEFGEKYTNLTKEKSRTSRKITDEQIRKAFEEYKNGKHTTEIARELGIKRCTLQSRLIKLFGKRYRELAKKRSVKDAGETLQKVSDKEIVEAFEKYKKSKITLKRLAKNLGIDHTSLIERFQKRFDERYKRIAKSRIEKVTKETCIKAFERYKNTDISLTQLADELGMNHVSLRERFLKLFGKGYKEITAKKGNLNEHFEKGRIFEEVVFEYFKLLGKNIMDTRRKCIFNGTRKKVDFLIADIFVEVKCNFIQFSNLGNTKGYKEILSDYLGKQIKSSNKTTKSGIIVSLSGFSKSVRVQAKKDGIRLIVYNELKKVFENNKRTDLALKLKKLKPWVSQLSVNQLSLAT